MPRTTLGPLPETSRIGLGLASLGRPAYINLGHDEDLEDRTSPSALEAHLHRMVDTAVDAGITYLDAARSYGRAEEFLSRWPRLESERDLMIGSKWGYEYVGGWRIDAEVHEVKNHGLETLQRQIEESQGWLGKHLHLYQIHSATPDTGVLTDDDVLTRLGELRDSGLVIGLTTSGPNQANPLRDALKIEVGGRRLFEVCEVTWNILEPSVATVAKEAHDAGMGVIVKEAVANGRLTSRGDMAHLADDQSVGLDAIAIGAALAEDWVDVVLSGATTAAQLYSNLESLTVAPNILSELPDIKEEPDRYWSQRSGLRWT